MLTVIDDSGTEPSVNHVKSSEIEHNRTETAPFASGRSSRG